MADTVRWIGGATAVAQVDHVTPGGTIESSDIFTLTLSNDAGYSHAITFTATDTTVKTVAEGLTAAALVAKTAGLKPWDGVTVSEDDAKVIITADTAGVPFTAVSTTTDGGGNDTQTLVRSASVANVGPYDWNTANDWDTGIVPAAGDTVWVEGATIKYGLDQSAAGTWAALHITRSQIGVNSSVGTTPGYLQVAATLGDINYHHGPGVPTFLAPVNIDFGTVQSAVTIWNTGTNAIGTKAAVRIKATHVSTTVTVLKGKVGVADEAGETATIDTITVGYVSQQAGDADVFIGDGVTLETLAQTGGDVVLNCAVTTAASISAGTLTTYGTGTIAALTVSGGAVTPNGVKTITALDISGGSVDFTKSVEARTVTTLKLDAPGALKYDPAHVTLTNQVQPVTASGAITYTAS